MKRLFTGWPIRKKLALGAALLLIAVTILAASGFSNAYSFRGLVRNISRRAEELPEAFTLAQNISALRATLPSRPMDQESFLPDETDFAPLDSLLILEFENRLTDVDVALVQYKKRLEDNLPYVGNIGNTRRELEAVGRMELKLKQIHRLHDDHNAMRPPIDEVARGEMVATIDDLRSIADQLPQHLRDKMLDLQWDVRGYYRTWIVLTWCTTAIVILLFSVLVQLFIRWVLRPIDQLIKDSRRIARGDFDHRIELNSGDEMDELAQAMNDMTGRFQEIRDDLDRQVQERTSEVIRGEQLASVGFLAAGVAHEINNPLASIALCAESLEERVGELLSTLPETEVEVDPAENNREVVRDYLRMIQDEAFRCKEITERLLDFSRLGDVDRQEVNLTELIQGVVDMVRHIGKYKEKQISFRGDEHIMVPVNAPELKQVVLNLITNGLDSLDPGGIVQVDLSIVRDSAQLVVRDNGCGMTDEVKTHLFEPFFTRRRDGQGTGLGMSITYRIINEHGGQIDAKSDGPGCGSAITVRLPLHPQNKESHHRHQAA